MEKEPVRVSTPFQYDGTKKTKNKQTLGTTKSKRIP